MTVANPSNLTGMSSFRAQTAMEAIGVVALEEEISFRRMTSEQ